LELDEKYWNRRYLNDQSQWDLGAVSTPLKNYFDTLSDKKLTILIPGAGNAYEAEYLAEKGFENVFVCDFAEEPLKNLANRTKKIDPKHLIKGDFFEMDEKIHSYDLIVEQTFFCALDPKLRANYFKKMLQLLKPKGKLVGLLFDCEFENSPPFGGNKEEYLGYIGSEFEILHLEKCWDSIEPRAERELFMILQKK
jgi:SAM-dependent methyltransferase